MASSYRDKLSSNHDERVILEDYIDKPSTGLRPATALVIAKEIGPRVYEIINHHSDTLRFIAFGCQGEPGEAQRNVAKSIDDLIESNPGLNFDFIVGLGDNIYKNGAISPTDPNFQVYFHDVYGNPKLKHLNKLPFFICLGNHDGNRHRWEEAKANYYRPVVGFFNKLAHRPKSIPPAKGAEAEINEIAHTYMTQGDEKDTREKLPIYTSDKLDLEKLQRWNMPYFFYSTVVGKVQIFYLNSNTYVKDFLELMRCVVNNEKVPPNNQAAWLAKEYANAIRAGRTVMFAQHHPLFTCGKRAYPADYDAYLYLEKTEIQMMNQILNLDPSKSDYQIHLKNILLGKDEETKSMPDNANYNEMLMKIYQQYQHFFPTIVFAAHDHSVYYYNNISDVPKDTPKEQHLCQVIAGGGGGELQDRVYFHENKNLGCFFKLNGYFVISCDKNNPGPENIKIEPYTTEGNHLIFTPKKSAAERKFEKEEPKVTILRKAILDACNDYLGFLVKKQGYYQGKFFSGYVNLTHSSTDIEQMHQIEAYLYQQEPDSFGTTVLKLDSLVEKLENQTSDNSLYKGINNKLALIRELDYKTLQELAEEMSPKKGTQHRKGQSGGYLSYSLM